MISCTVRAVHDCTANHYMSEYKNPIPLKSILCWLWLIYIYVFNKTHAHTHNCIVFWLQKPKTSQKDADTTRLDISPKKLADGEIYPPNKQKLPYRWTNQTTTLSACGRMTAAMTAPPCARKRPREDYTDPNLKTAEGHRTIVSLSFNSTVGLEPAVSIYRGNTDSIPLLPADEGEGRDSTPPTWLRTWAHNL